MQIPLSIQMIGAGIFVIAILHTFSTKFFEHLAHVRPAHAGVWHLLGEVEVVFGFWAMIMVLLMFVTGGSSEATRYVDSRNFTEPMFVFAIMVIAATRPVLHAALAGVRMLSSALPLPGSMGFYVTTLTLTPLLGSFLTEPAAMTLSAMILADHFFSRTISTRLKYATIGVLFVNVSIGGALTPFAAPPVLMVAGKWGWSLDFMLHTFGWKCALAVGINAWGVALLFRKELANLPLTSGHRISTPVPVPLTAAHLAFLTGVVVFAHHPAIFMSLFLFFLGLTHAYQRHQDRLLLREGLMVAFFLAGLVVLGGMQRWWLEPLLLHMGNGTVFVGAVLLTAITDNAALTYLGSLAQGLSAGFQYALVAGAITGGGLTVIANAPNPAGMALLRRYFEDDAVHPGGLFLAALLPTIIAALAFRML